MKKEKDFIRFRTISEIHDAAGLPKPQHPLISMTTCGGNTNIDLSNGPVYDVLDFYKIVLITDHRKGKMKYGQSHYDFNEGSLLFLAPNQVVGSVEQDYSANTRVLLFHPDFLLGFPLAQKIKQYQYFSYSVNEALHLSDQEREVMLSLFKIMKEELSSRIDEFSQEVVIAQLELLLHYANRFYKRQFITRKGVNNDLLQKTEAILDAYFSNQQTLQQGKPTVQFLADQLHISAGYLSDMLRSLIGQSAQQYIHFKLIERAKERLSTTQLSVSEIAFELGFEHPQSFSKLFKSKTNQTPLEFRTSFN
ncbi:helix-turn-helix domain-containing protein [Sinomicrobium soli]|uniref:helix-turn-helix domain-containing protein n=1 Tax=Sinomicrobium sp. N-1-3-6 TaxID=2219864 RepID=UPI000DCE000A|nr:helix-turn-helix transcriptional regulator [Sinomicrobium sp. N-1-3-6]RAV27782.1 AraC family transcriptional regulator [Sinomicrobium sp. N-1-3-6]